MAPVGLLDPDSEDQEKAGRREPDVEEEWECKEDEDELVLWCALALGMV